MGEKFREPSPFLTELNRKWDGREKDTGPRIPARNGSTTNRRASAADASAVSPEATKALLKERVFKAVVLSPSEIQKKSLIDRSGEAEGKKNEESERICAAVLPPPMTASADLRKPSPTMKEGHPTPTNKRASTGNMSIFSPTRQLSAKWTTLLVQTKQVVKAKRKIKQKKAKLRNLCADKLQDVDDYVPPIHEKSSSEKDLIRLAMKNNFVFDKLPTELLDTLADAFEQVEFAQGETIIKQGAKGDYFYVIKDGEIDFFVDETKVGTAKAGNSFGELSLLYTCRRAATAKASTKSSSSDKEELPKTILFRVDQKCFRYILKDQMKKAKRLKMKLLHKIKPFRELEKSDLKVLAAAMEPKIFEKGEVVCIAGEPSPLFCVVQDGELDFTQVTIGDKDCKDRKLGPGDYFGENHLLSDKPAEGTVTAVTRVLTFAIDREVFDRDFGGLKRLKVKAADKRHLSVVASIRKANFNDETLTTLADHVVDVIYETDCPIFEMGKKVNPAIYLVREGQVELKKEDGTTEIVSVGGSFGQEWQKEHYDEIHVESDFSATALERTVCGVLSLPDCPVMFDQHMIGMVAERYTPGNDLVLDDLNRHRVLGEGQFGEVWLVSSKKEDDPKGMALKMQKKDNNGRAEGVKAVWDEIKAMRKIEHKWLVSLITSFQDTANIYMLMTLAHGGELFDIIHQEDENGDYVSGLGDNGKFYAAVIADALAFMHRQKFVYRDLKPENVLIDDVGYPLLTDFGFAKYIEDKTYTFCGTPNYLPPEVIRNSGHDFSADNWSLGVVIYELVEGENPFFYPGMDQMTLFESICTDTPYPVEKEVSNAALDLIDKLLTKNPDKRLGTFRQKDILAHEWFSDIDLHKLRRKKLESPWVPDPLILE